jgi:hypothetical protein
MTHCDLCKWAQREPIYDSVIGCQMNNEQELVPFGGGYQAIEQPCPDFIPEDEEEPCQ